MISKYQFMEQNLQRRVSGLDEKLPDIQKTLDTVRFLQTRRPGANKDTNGSDDELESDGDDEADDGEAIETTFELNDTLYAKATIPPTDEVYLWLGANVMLSYPIDEAQTLLEQKLNSAQTTRRNCEEDLEFLREQITVSPECDCPTFILSFLTNTCHRQWRSQSHGYTTGMLCRSARRRRRPSRARAAVVRAALTSRMAEQYVVRGKVMIYWASNRTEIKYTTAY